MPFLYAIHFHNATNLVKSPIDVTSVTKRKHTKKSPTTMFLFNSVW